MSILSKKNAAQPAITLSQEDYLGLFDNSADSIIVMDIKGLIMRVNKKALEISGYRESDIVGKKFNELAILTPESNRLALANFQKKMKGLTVSPYRVEIIKKNRKKMPAEISSFYLKKDGKISGEVVIIHDLTEVVKSEAKTKMDNYEYESMFNTTPTLIIFKGKDDKIIKANKAFSDFMGLPAEKLAGKTTFDVIRPDSVAKKVRADDLEVIKTGKSKQNVVTKLISAFSKKEIMGRYTKKPFYDEEGKIAGTVTFVVDISETFKAQDIIKQSEMRYRRLFEAAQDAILILDADTGKIVDANPYVERLLEYAPGELVGKEVWELSPLKDIIANKDKFKELQAKKYVHYEDLPLQTRNGIAKQVEFVSNVYEVENKLVVQCNIRDISERKKIQELRQEKEAQISSISNNLLGGMIYQAIRKKNGTRVFTYLSERVKDFYGVTPEAVIANADLVYGRVYKEDRQRLYEEEEKANRNLATLNIEARIVDPRGNIRWSNFISNPTVMPDGSTVWDGIEFDVTERKQNELKLKSLNQDFSLITKVNQALIKIKDEAKLRQQICDLITGSGEYEIAWVGLAQDDEAKSVTPAAYSGRVPEDFKKFHVSWGESRFGLGPTGTAIRTGKTFITNDYSKENKVSVWRDLALKLGLKSAIALPLKVDLKTIGALTIYSARADVFFPEEVEILEELANDLAFGMNSLRVNYERQFAENVLSRQRDVVFKLNQVKDFKEASKVCLDAIISIPEVSGCGFYLVDKKSGQLDILGYSGLSDEFMKEASHFEPSSSEAKLVAKARPFYQQYKKISLDQSKIKLKEGLRALAVIPIVFEGNVVADLNVASKTVDSFSESTKKFMEIIAQSMGVAINRLSKEKELLAEKTFSDAIIESIPGNFYVVDQRGKFVRWNNNEKEMLGLSDEKMKEVAITYNFDKSSLVSGDIKKDFAETFKLGHAEVEARMKTADGTYRDMLLTAKTVMIDQNLYLVGVGVDQTEKNKAKKILEESEDKLKIIFENAPDPIYLHDLKGNFIDGNKAAERISGYKREELIGKNFLSLNLIKKKDVPKITGVLAQNVLGQKVGPYQFTMTSKDGREIELENISYPVKIGGKLLVISVSRDITEKNRYLDQLKENEERLNIVFENSPEGILLTDIKGNLISVNKALEEILGLKRSVLIGKNFMAAKFLSAVEQKQSDAQMAQISSGKVTEAVKYFTNSNEQERRLVEVSLYPVKVRGDMLTLGVIRNITEQEKITGALRENEERLNVMFEYAPDPIFLYEVNGTFIDGNRAAEALIGYKRNEMIGKNFLKLKLLPADQLVAATKALAKNAFGQRTANDEIRLLTRAGKEIEVEISSFPITVKGRKIIMGIARDISERKKSQEELKDSAVRYQALFNASRDIFIQLDRLGNIVDINKAIEEYGFKKSDFIGKKVFSLLGLFGKEGVGLFLKAYRQRMAGQEIKPYEVKIRFNNQEKYAEISANSLKDEAGKIYGALVVMRDVTDRRQAVDQIRESADRYLTIFNSSRDIIIQLDITGKLIDINKSIERYGYTREESINVGMDKFSRYFDEEDTEKIKQSIVQRLKNEEVPNYEVGFRSANGQVYNFEVSGVLIHDSKNKPSGILVIMHDLTERKRTEDVVKSAARRYKMLFEASRDILIQLDLSGRIIDLNERVQYYGFKRSELISKNLEELRNIFSPEDISRLNESLSKRLAGGEMAPYGVNLISAKGEVSLQEVTGAALFSDDGVPIGSLLVLHDISENKKAEDEIKQKIEELERLNKLMVGRELKMTELKEQIRKLKAKEE